MKKNNLLLGSLLLVAASIGAQATPACVAAPLSTYIAFGFECTFAAGQLTIKEITFSRLTLSGTPVLAGPADITIIPPTGISDALGFTSPKFIVSGDQGVRYIFTYIIDPPPEIIPSMNSSMLADSPVGNATATLTTDICVTGTFGGTGCVPIDSRPTEYHTLTVYHFGDFGKKLKDSVIFDNPTNFVHIRNTLDLRANGDVSEIRGVSTSIGVPEPAAMGLVGAGLLALGLITRRRA